MGRCEFTDKTLALSKVFRNEVQFGRVVLV